MHETIQRKNTQSTINVGFEYYNADFAFNERTWQVLKPEVEKFIVDSGIGNISDPPVVPV